MTYYLSSIGFGLILFGSIFSNILYLRLFMLIGNLALLFWAIFELTTDRITTVVWEILFILFHSFHLVKLLIEKHSYCLIA